MPPILCMCKDVDSDQLLLVWLKVPIDSPVYRFTHALYAGRVCQQGASFFTSILLHIGLPWKPTVTDDIVYLSERCIHFLVRWKQDLMSFVCDWELPNAEQIRQDVMKRTMQKMMKAEERTLCSSTSPPLGSMDEGNGFVFKLPIKVALSVELWTHGRDCCRCLCEGDTISSTRRHHIVSTEGDDKQFANIAIHSSSPDPQNLRNRFLQCVEVCDGCCIVQSYSVTMSCVCHTRLHWSIAWSLRWPTKVNRIVYYQTATEFISS